MAKFYHNTRFLNNVFKKTITEIIEKETLNFRLSLIMLNRPINKDIFIPLYLHATNVIMCDGAANRLHDLFEDERAKYLPTHLTGDLDSWRPEVKEYYEAHEVEVSKDEDENTTDFQK
jgi:thiamine pyrophosphokinase